MVPLHDEEGELFAWHLLSTGELIPLKDAELGETP
jgi:hypothetical protein